MIHLNQILIDNIKKVVKNAMIKESFVEVEASGRHIHLSREAIDVLFGKDYTLTKAKGLSQPGQYACKERITIEGPKGKIENVIILGPERKETQVEVSLTDAVSLGIQAPVRESGDIEGTPGIKLIHNNRELTLDKGLIVAQRHIHVSPEDAEKLNVENKEVVQVKVFGDRSLIFDEVVIRIHPNYRTYMHIDFDEANACGFKRGTLAKVIKKTPAVQQVKNHSERQPVSFPSGEKQMPTEFADIHKKVITENDLQKFFLQNITNIRIPAKSLITPLADDFIRKHRLNIEMHKESRK